MLWGVNGHPLVSYPGVTIDQQLGFIRDLGMKSYRVDIGRPDQIPGLARLVKAGKSHGVEILPVVVPALDLDRESPEQLYAKAHALAVALVSRFKDEIRVWELGNELENYAILKPCEMQDDGVQYNCAWGPAGGVTPLEYYGPRWAKVSGVLKGLSDGTTSVDPTIRKAMGTAGWGHLGAFTRMQQDGIRWDISVWHMYGQDPEWAFKFLSGFKRPIWVTEFNNASGGYRSALEQADGLLRSMIRLRQLHRTYNVEAAHLYELMDESYWAPSFEAFMGLVGLDKKDNNQWMPGARKPAYSAVKALIANRPSPADTASDCHLNPFNKLDSIVSMQVSYIYCLALQRPVDGWGFKDWSNALGKGLKPVELLQSTISSAEAQTKHGLAALDDGAFIDRVYNLLLARAPTERESASYLAGLLDKSVARPGLIAALINSGEFRDRHSLLFPIGSDLVPPSAPKTSALPKNSFAVEQRRSCDLAAFDATDRRRESQVAYAFCLVLGRAGDPEVLKLWSDYRREALVSSMLPLMLTSPEFRDRHGVPGLRTSDFVALLYRFLLDREPDPRGQSDYVAQIEAGNLPRSELAARLVASAEFASRHPLLVAAAPSPAQPPPN